MSRVISSVAGTRTEPKDSYMFVRGTTATFKITFLNNDRPVQVDTNTTPNAKILAPAFLNSGNTPVPEIIATLDGSLSPGQDFEYQFTWDIPVTLTPIDNFIISYQGLLGGQQFNFGDEFFTVVPGAGMINIQTPMFATVDDVRMKKFNIDTFMPEQIRADLTARNSLIENHLRDAADRLREELNLNQTRGMSANYRLFCVYYTIYTILLASRGEDGSSVSDNNINFWKGEAERILAQEKRKGVMQGVPMGRG